MASIANCELQEDPSSSDFSVISHPPEDSLVNGLSFRPLSAHLPLDDFRTQLQDLLQENAQLKEALLQNTTLMKQNFTILGAWQDKVATTNRRHKFMLQESARLLLEMRKENQALRTRVQELESAVETTKEFEPTKAIQTDPKYVQGSDLVSVDDEAGFTVVHSFPRKFDVSRNSKEAELESVLASSLNQASSCLDKYINRLSRLFAKLNGKMEGPEIFREDVTTVLTLLKDEFQARQQDEKSLHQVREQLDKLLLDHQILLNSLKSTQCEERQTEVLRTIEKRQEQERSDLLTAQLVSVQEELSACQDRLRQQEKRIFLLQHDSEQVPILRAQLEVYRQDFDAVSDRSKRHVAQLERVKQEMESLRYRNLQLEELNQHTKRRGQRLKKSSLAAEHDSMMTEEMILTCPKCPLEFTNRHALENHLDKCLPDDCSPYP